MGPTKQGRDLGTRVAPGKCKTAGLSGLIVLSIGIISPLILAPSDIVFNAAAAVKKLTFLSWETGGSLSTGSRKVAAIEAIVSPFYVVVPVQDTYIHS